MRVAYFNEIDTYCELKNLDTKAIIEGIGYDERIGSHYNNPSFGYGGYCLPKDTKQLKANYQGIPQEMISAIVDANSVRKQHITEMILARKPKIVGIYRLAMKKNSDNFRKSAILDVIELLKEHCEVVIYEPHLQEGIEGTSVEMDLTHFKQKCDVIVVNRYDECLNDVKDKIYTRDIYERD
jgi:UDPglucose 6-dehydrogenase